MSFVHTHEWSEGEPNWETIETGKLPREAFAVSGDEEDDKTWKYPHHYVQTGGGIDNHGKFTTGRLMLHSKALMEQSKKADSDGDKDAQAHFAEHWKTVDPDKDGVMKPITTGLQAYQEKKVVPSYAFQMPMSIALGNNGEGAKSAPIKMIALSGEVLDREEWGACIQDLAGMISGSRIPIDYCHNSQEIIGYANTFDTSSGQLVVSGALVPQKTHKRTEEIIQNISMGVPYQASIFFQPSKADEMEIEYVASGMSAEVNGKTVQAPKGGLTIFRKWPLQGIAVCPYGADDGTAVHLQSKTDRTISVTINKVKGEQTMDKNAEAEAAKKAAVEAEAKAKFEQEAKAKAEADAKFKQEAEEEKAKVEKEEAEEVEGESRMQKTIKQFTAKFGAEKAMEYLSKGLKYEAALEAFCDEAKKAMEQSASKSPAKPKVKFEQSSEASSDLPAGYDEYLDKYCRDYNRTPAEKDAIRKNYKFMLAESRRLGPYEPSAGAGKFDPTAGMTRVGHD